MPDSIKAKAEALLAHEGKLDEIVDHVANGGSLINLCETWGIRYSDAVRWVYASPERKDAYDAAIKARDEWGAERLMHELRQIAIVDLRQAFDDEGRLKPMSEWPAAVAAALAGFENEELYDGQGDNRVNTGRLRKVKTYDKLKAIEMMGKQMAMFVERRDVKVDGELKLDEIVGASWPTPTPKEAEAQSGTEQAGS